MENALLCQRFIKSDIGRLQIPVVRKSDNLKRGSIQFPTTMRTTPTVTFPNAALDGQSLGTIDVEAGGVFITGHANDSTVQTIYEYEADATL